MKEWLVSGTAFAGGPRNHQLSAVASPLNQLTGPQDIRRRDENDNLSSQSSTLWQSPKQTESRSPRFGVKDRSQDRKTLRMDQKKKMQYFFPTVVHGFALELH